MTVYSRNETAFVCALNSARIWGLLPQIKRACAVLFYSTTSKVNGIMTWWEDIFQNTSLAGSSYTMILPFFDRDKCAHKLSFFASMMPTVIGCVETNVVIAIVIVLHKSSFVLFQVQNAISSEPGEGRIINFREYDKKFSPHMVSS
jgi:hypothetical protein